MPKDRISLSERSVQGVVSLCKRIRRKSSDNHRSAKMAGGIEVFASMRGYISRKQAAWLKRSAEYWRLPFPVELHEINLGADGRAEMLKSSSGSICIDDLLSVLRRMEMKLDAALKQQSDGLISKRSRT